jgi:hypothetical protein
MVLGIGGPLPAKLTCLATAAIAFVAGAGVQAALERVSRPSHASP